MRFKKLRKGILNWLVSAAKDDNEPSNANMAMDVKCRAEYEDMSLNSRKIQFSVVPGVGGVAIEVRQYDDRNGDWIITLHIVPEGDELSEAISRIITLESLR